MIKDPAPNDDKVHGGGVPELRKVRLFLQLGESDDYRYIAWFGLKGRDFYWGPGSPVPDVASVPFSGMSAKFDIPEDLDTLPRTTWKASRHESGVLHVNSTGKADKGMRDVYVGPVTNISKPMPFAVLLDKLPLHMAPYRRSLTRERAMALIVRVSDSARECRPYFEFYLSPAGSFPAPPVIIQLKEPSANAGARIITQSLSVESDVVLVIRHITMTSGPSDLRPEVGMWMTLHPNDDAAPKEEP